MINVVIFISDCFATESIPQPSECCFDCRWLA